MSSRLRAVRLFVLSCKKTNVYAAPPEAGMPAADVPPCSRLRGVAIFEQNGALASMTCALRFQTGSVTFYQGQRWLGHDGKRQKLK